MNSQLKSLYLSLLQMEEEVPAFDYLQRLVSRHLQRFPFENVSKFHYYSVGGIAGMKWLPSLETFLNHRLDRGMGGNCYILNAHFGSLLRALGFDVGIVRATGGNMHLGLMVTIEAQAYYVDVGYGAPLFQPLVLEEQPRFSRCGEEVEVRKIGDNHFMIDRRTNGQSFVVKYIEWTPVSLDSFEDAITHSLRDEADNPFMRRIVATVFKDGIGHSVVNHKLFLKSNEGTEVHEYTDKQEWLAMMNATFGIQSGAVEEALAFLERRDVKLF